MNPVNGYGYVTTTIVALWCAGAIALTYKIASDAHRNVHTGVNRDKWQDEYQKLSNTFKRAENRERG